MVLCSMLYASLDGRGLWGRMDTCIYIWLNPFAVHLKLPHIVNRLYPNAKKKKFQVWGKNVYYHLQAKKEALVRNGCFAGSSAPVFQIPHINDI